MGNRMVSVGEDFTLPDDVKVADVNLPERLAEGELNATIVNQVGYAPGYDIVILAGQSNMAGRGTPYSATLDPAHPRISQWGTHGTLGIKPASEPLDMHEGVASGNGPGLQFARWYAARRLTPRRKVLLVPVAHGGTQLSSNATLAWRRGGVAGNLYANMITQAQAALAAANAIPDTANQIVAILWLQGESDGDNSVTATQYRTDLDAMINGSRTDLGIVDLPWVIGTMVPEYLTTGTRAVINMVHRDTPNRITRTDVAVSAVGMNKGDGNHFNGPGSRFNGKAMYEAYERIAEGIAPYSEGLPADFGPVAGLALGAATALAQPLTWTAFSGATSYLVEYRETGSSTWITAGQPATNSFTVGPLKPSTSYDYSVSPADSNGVGYRATVSGSTAAATTVVSDAFSRTASSLGNADTGQAWNAVFGSWVTDGNYAYHGSATDNLAVLNSTKADAIVRARFPVLGTAAGDTVRLVFRGDGTVNNYWLIQYRAVNNVYQVYKRVAGAYTQIGSNLSVTPAANDLVEAAFYGSTIVFRINGIEVARVTDAALASNTYHGLGGGPTNVARFDDFAVLS